MTNTRLKTLERMISKAGLGSRADARRWIAAGRVGVDGKTVRNPDEWVDPERARITFDGKSLGAGAGHIYIALYKPTGYVTSRRDAQGRETVYELIGDVGRWVTPVGRLDRDTSGLLLMTSDTDFVERLTNPKHEVPKTYLIKAASLLSDEQLQRLRDGVQLDDGPTRPAGVTRVRDAGKHTFLELVLREGRNRQARRMIDAIGSRVLKLVRTRVGPLELGKLPIGKWRRLTAEEVRALMPGHAATPRARK